MKSNDLAAGIHVLILAIGTADGPSMEGRHPWKNMLASYNDMAEYQVNIALNHALDVLTLPWLRYEARKYDVPTSELTSWLNDQKGPNRDWKLP
jgi:hypothetical protein